MVITERSTSTANRLERVKALKDAEDTRRRELEELERKKKEEMKRLEAELSETIREINEEDEEKFAAEERRKRTDQRNLEETVREEAPEKVPRAEEANISYIAQNIMTPGADVSIYDVTNYNVYSKVKELVSKAEGGEISDTERNFLSSVSYHVDRFRNQEMYERTPQSTYLSRTRSLLERIDKQLGERSNL